MGFARNRADQYRIDHVTLRHIDQIKKHSTEASIGIARDAVRRRLQCHGAGGHFVQPTVDGICFGHVGEWNVNRDVAVRPEG